MKPAPEGAVFGPLPIQEFQFGDGDKATVAQWLAKQDKDLKIVAFKRFTLVAD